MRLRGDGKWSRLAAAGAALAFLGAPQAATPAPQAGAPAPSPQWGRLPPDLATILEAKTAGYVRRALHFTCFEKIRKAKYKSDEAGEDVFKDYDYLLVQSPGTLEGFRALHTRPKSRNLEGEKVNLPFPDPYLWSELFDPRVQSLLRYSVGPLHTTPWRLAIPIRWTTAAPAGDGRRITEWSGTVEIEYETGNLVRVVARPAFQDERIDAELERYLTAFRFMGWAAAPAPIGLELTVDFDYEHEGFTYPTRVELLTFRLVHRGVRETVSRQVVEYGAYRFFGTKVEDHIPPLLWRPPAAEPAPPPKGPAR